jgi:glycosyltransferase involved in cell wall biosynthesis
VLYVKAPADFLLPAVVRLVHAHLFTRYPESVASTRERLLRLRPHLASHGISTDVWQFFDDSYEPSKRARSPQTTIAAYARRLSQIWRVRGKERPGCAIVQYELLPFLPAWLERAMLGGDVPIIIDYDDAWHHHYRQHRSGLVRALCGSKIERLMSQASAVAAGSEYLMTFASRYTQSVGFVPTGLELAEFPEKFAEAPGFIVGWIGSPATARHINSVTPLLANYLEQVGGRLLVVGARTRSETVGVVDYQPWSQEVASEFFRRIHVGVMPLPDSHFEHGKCAYKLIQYMAAWRPAVASPIGENRNVVERSGAGYLAASDAEWLTALEALRTSPSLRRDMGTRARHYVADNYTHSRCAAELASLLRRACSP